MLLAHSHINTDTHGLLHMHVPTVAFRYAFPSVANDPTIIGRYDRWNDFPAAVLNPGATYVLCDKSAHPSILKLCNYSMPYLGNGNDAYCLVHGNRGQYTAIDCVGDFLGNPGKGWDVCGVAEATADHTLVRKGSISHGNANWTQSAGTNKADCEWLVYPKDTRSDIGRHPANTPRLSSTYLFSNNMVLQQSSTLPAKVSGRVTEQGPAGQAREATLVTLTSSNEFHPRQSYTAAVDSSGKWEVVLQPYVVEDGDSNKFTLKATASRASNPNEHVAEIIVRNVAYGEVLLCSGQSNMEIPVRSAFNATAVLEGAHAHRLLIRLFTVEHAGNSTPQTRLTPAQTPWRLSTAGGVGGFSAICYATALNLHALQTEAGQRRKVYGLVQASVGSTDIQSWMNAEARANAAKCWTPKAAKLPPSFSQHEDPPGTQVL